MTKTLSVFVRITCKMLCIHSYSVRVDDISDDITAAHEGTTLHPKRKRQGSHQETKTPATSTVVGGKQPQATSAAVNPSNSPSANRQQSLAAQPGPLSHISRQEGAKNSGDKMEEMMLSARDVANALGEQSLASFDPIFAETSAFGDHLSASSSDDLCSSPDGDSPTSVRAANFDADMSGSGENSPIAFDPAAAAPAAVRCHISAVAYLNLNFGARPQKRSRKRTHRDSCGAMPVQTSGAVFVPLMAAFGPGGVASQGATPLVCYAQPQQVMQQAQAAQAASSSPPVQGMSSFPLAPVHATLPPDEELMRMSTEQIEEYIRACKASALISVGDERRLRKVRRLIKNREYAQQSRNKKKQLVGDMEKDLSGVRDENTRLARELSAARTRNAELEAENELLRRTLTNAGIPIPAPPPPQQTHGLAPSHGSRRIGTVGAAGAAVCLLAVVLFGLFVGPLTFGGHGADAVRASSQAKLSPTARTLMSAEALSAALAAGLSGPASRGGAGWPPSELAQAMPRCDVPSGAQLDRVMTASGGELCVDGNWTCSELPAQPDLPRQAVVCYR